MPDSGKNNKVVAPLIGSSNSACPEMVAKKYIFIG